MVNFKCRYTQARLLAFLHRDLPESSRRAVARHLDHCPHCAALYQQQRQHVHALRAELGGFATPSAPTLERIWMNIQDEMMPPPSPAIRSHAPKRRYSLSYGLLTVIVVLVLMVPWLLRTQPAYAAVPSQPAPHTEATFSTPGGELLLVSATPVAWVALTDPARHHMATLPHNTPAPALP